MAICTPGVPMRAANSAAEPLMPTLACSRSMWRCHCALTSLICNTASCRWHRPPAASLQSQSADCILSHICTMVYTVVRRRHVEVATVRVCQVACGARHSCAVTAAGALLCWGWNLHGQCGGGEVMDSVTCPQLVRMPLQLRCKQVGLYVTCNRQL